MKKIIQWLKKILSKKKVTLAIALIIMMGCENDKELQRKIDNVCDNKGIYILGKREVKVIRCYYMNDAPDRIEFIYLDDSSIGDMTVKSFSIISEYRTLEK